ncbi:choice-of-anchor M domain-containing protein [Actinophytocola algeriensis]|uniref:Putative ABC transporter-associated repeat protein n=1 Tax=Actinophytocola algeriensis TaxID=1768010 RepID=A0A7W7VFW1_9PSEU|nr:choice-of-anchor M domain-containing protein [Actinophytocola algeriensis]MBB4908716.1 putative ABC transporter-associated repeat protein [Actinophytocola algeriensis]MBE1474897.1 putative ABC transporter-associated repeat protein [Actinophytocola algeriensis]
MRRVLAVFAAAALLVPAGAVTAQGQPPPGDGLDQTIDSGQSVATDRKVLSQGHVDVGPRFTDGEWTLMVHDATSDPSVWRHLDRTVFQVSDAGVLPVPDDPAYSFIGLPGTPVHVLPQVQNPDVVWVGWNTQDPEVMATIDGGATLRMSGVDGPGELFVYLQAGNFGAADVLWDSTKDGAQEVWVDVNTHTHANWVFTEPGVYTVRVEVTADLVDGSTVTDSQALRFAVGDATDVEAAFAADVPAPAPGSASAQPAARADEAAGDGGGEGGGPGLLLFAIGAVAVLLLAGVFVVAARGRAAKRAALSARDES